jgi:hypothetical protein
LGHNLLNPQVLLQDLRPTNKTLAPLFASATAFLFARHNHYWEPDSTMERAFEGPRLGTCDLFNGTQRYIICDWLLFPANNAG